MSRSLHLPLVFSVTSVLLIAGFVSCTPEENTTFSIPPGATGGAATTGGMGATGGAGVTGFGGGIVGYGGAKPTTTVPGVALGGSTGVVGTTAKGGAAVGVGGAVVVGQGGAVVVGQGGAVGVGGAVVVGQGGAVTATTVSGPANTGTTVTFAAGKGVGAMTGYAFVALGSADTISSPTCGTAAITAATPCASGTTWASATSLCVSGAIPALPATPVAADYASNWGLSVGLNAGDPAGGGLAQAHSAVALTFTGTPTAGLRAVVHKKGDPDSTSYCVDKISSGTAIPLTSFATDCYNAVPAGLKITAADIPNIDKISLQVSSTSAAITVTSLCLTGITFS